MAWLQDNSSNQTHVVATKVPNAFGFYDMLGNVWEWTTGCHAAGQEYARGGSFDHHSGIGTYRQWLLWRSYRSGAIGLRLAAYNRSKISSDGCGKTESSESDAAQRQATVDGYTWSYRVRNGEAMIVTANGRCAVSPSPKGAVSIPSTLGGVKVTSIGYNAFRNCRGLTSVTIPSGVASIGNCAFGDCAELRNVTIPSSVRNIGEWAFSGCFALKSVTIPPNVERIGGGAFNNCRGLTSVTIPAKVASIGAAAFVYCSALRQINVDAGNQSFTSIDGVLYTKDRSVLLVCPNAVTSVEMPKSVTNVGWCAFEGCSGLKSVTIPEGVTSIESGAFKACGGLVSVTIPSSVKIIGAEAFLNCKGLMSVTLPEGLSDIWGSAFWGCGELASLTLPKGLTTIGDNAFRGLGKLTTVTIPAEVTSIGGSVFSYCGGLTQINVEAGNQKYTSVDGVLYTKDMTELVMCPDGLTSMTIPESVTSIGPGAFIGCGKLTSVMLPSGVSYIGEWTFEACNGLTSVTIPESVTKIDRYAFLNCGGLTSLTMRGERPDAPNNIFQGCGNLKAIHVPANAKSWEGMKDWNGIPLVKSSLLKPSLLSLRGRRLLREQQRETEPKAAGVESVTVKTRKDIDRLFPGWSLDSTVLNESNKDLCSGFHASHRGQNNVLYLHPANMETPVVLSRTVTLSDKNPCLFIKIASWDEGSDFLLSVRVNGKYAMPDRLVCTSDVEPWEDLVVPLFDWRGSLVKIEIVLSANNWWSERAQLARIEIAEGNGQEKCGLAGIEDATVNGSTWSYRVRNGEATIVAEKHGRYSCAVSPMPTGDVSIPSTLGGVKVTSIGRCAFLMCGGLTSVTIPEGVTSIDRDAFYDCNALKTVTIPTSVKYIGLGAFNGCSGLTSATIPDGVTHIGVLAFSRCSGLTSVVIPSGVDVGRRAFSWCYGLKSVTISEGVTRIGREVFRDCTGLKSVTIPEGVTDIDPGAFMGCRELGSVTIPASVTNIEWLAFSGCEALTQINVAAGNQRFALVDGVLYTKDLTELVMCPNGLSSATIQPSVKSIRADAFRGCVKLTAVTIPANVESCSCAFTYCGALKQINVDVHNQKYASVDGVVYTKDLEELVMAPGGVKSVPILAGVKRIGDGAFKGCSTLTSVTIPSGVARILPWTFEGCAGLKSVTILGNVTYIGSQAFWNCSELTSFTMRGERPEAPNDIFMGCGKLKSIHVPANTKSWAGMKDWLGIPLVFDGESVNERVDAPTQEMSVVANKLKSCDFLLNKDFKKDAKYYLCLFSASWCGPCRAEMPRIAKTYAETLKDDPNVELIHFSCDQDDEKALAWAKEHDVKFPVVKPNGGNPLDLRARGIPHLFIVKADGTLVEEGHPMKLFTDEKLRELKIANCSEGVTGKTKTLLSGKEIIDGVEWTYSIKDGKAQVDYASSSNVTGAISIPSTLGGYPVTSIRGRRYGQPGVFEECCKLTAVTIPLSVTSIGDRAFERCTNLTSVTIQSSATSIGSFAFFGCNSLESIVIPSGVTSIGWRAFDFCSGLASVRISASVKRIEREAFNDCSNLMSFSVESDNPSYSSRNGLLCSKDGSILVAGVNGDVTIPPSVTRIEDGAFDGYSGLTGVTIPSSVTRIGKRAFAICSRLTSVKIPSSVTSIGGDAFNGTPFYRNLPDGMVVLGGGVLCGYKGKCPSAVVIPSNVTSIAGEAFSERFLRRSGAGLQSVVIASSVTDIGSRAFSYCGDLANVTMLGERPNAPNNIFERCGNLKAIHVPANAKSWAGMKDWLGIPLVFGGESKAEDSWNSAQDVEYKFNYKLDDKGNAILTGVSPKPEGALVCPNIIEGHKVTGIDRGAFNGCDKMTKIMLPEHLETLPVWVSGWCIHGSIFYGCTALSSIGISETNPKFASVDGALYSKDKKVLFAYPKDRTEIKVCRETTSIQGDAFHSSLLFKKINIPEGISYTGGFAFSACPNLEEVIFPKEFGSINHHAFSYCPKMKKVVFLGDSPEAYWRRTASRENVFYGAARDIVVYVRKGSKGWNGKDSTDLPGRWPLDGSDSRPIRYIDEAADKMNDAFSLNAAPGSITELDLGNVPPLQFVYCPAGKFSMGYKEQPAISKVKDVEITSPFWVSKTVIRADQLELLGLNSITNTETGDAVINDGSIVLEKLPSALKERFGKMLPPGYVFRLPTEAEFEYLQKSEMNDKNAQTNIWGVERLYSGGLVALLDKAPAYGRVDVVRRRNHRGVIMTDLVKVNYENQPDKDPVGWTDDPTWSVFRRGLARNCGGGKLVTAPGGGKYHYSFYFVVAPDINKLNKFYWK